MLPEPWRVASSRARISAARASGESVGRRGGRQVAVAAVRRLARDAERLRDRGERLARLQGARDVRALEHVELAPQRGQAGERARRFGDGERALEQRDDLRGIGGHGPTTR